MEFKTIKELPLVLGNVLDKNNNIDKVFAMTVEEIPYFIVEYSTNNRLLILVPVSELPILEVDYGVISNCWEEEYLTELLETLLPIQSGIEEAKAFKPLCQTYL